MKSHNEFLEEVKEKIRKPTLAEETHDALNVKEVSQWEVLWEVVRQELLLTRE